MLSRRTLLLALAATLASSALPLPGYAKASGGKGGPGGNGKGGGKAGGGSAGARRGASQGKSSGNSNAAGKTASRSLRTRHSNGFQEILSRGRYQMRDNRGRVIVDRRAMPADYARLRRLVASP